MNTRSLPNNWILQYTDNGSHKWAAKGRLRVHKSMDRYTAYTVEPFKRLGMYDTATEAMRICDASKN